MLNGVTKALLVSLLLHAILFLLLSAQFCKTQTSIPKPKANKPQTIKSFLYTPIRQKVTNTIEQSSEKYVSTPKSQPIVQAPKKKVSKSLSIKKTDKPKIQTIEKTKHVKNKYSLKDEPKNIITEQKLKEQLNNLRKNQLNTPYDSVNERTHSTVRSIFNPTPKLVPKSTTKTPEKIEAEKQLRTTNYGAGISIEKRKSGNCAIKQDLSSVGIEGVTSTQYFSCGKSEFDQNFSDHIKKAMKKYE